LAAIEEEKSLESSKLEADDFDAGFNAYMSGNPHAVVKRNPKVAKSANSIVGFDGVVSAANPAIKRSSTAASTTSSICGVALRRAHTGNIEHIERHSDESSSSSDSFDQSSSESSSQDDSQSVSQSVSQSMSQSVNESQA